MAIYGYARISTAKQNIERQIRNITETFPGTVIYQENYTGTRLDRPEWKKLHRKLQSGDTIVFDSVSRMSRNAEEGFALYKELYQRNISLVFMKEPHINTDVFRETIKKSVPLTGTDVDYILEGFNRYLLALAEKQIAIAFQQAQKEVDDLHQRTREGIETARRTGKQIGRPGGKEYTTKKERVPCQSSSASAGTLTATTPMPRSWPLPALPGILTTNIRQSCGQHKKWEELNSSHFSLYQVNRCFSRRIAHSTAMEQTVLSRIAPQNVVV